MNSQKKKVCLITPNHISTNPRLVKEAIALENHGFDVHLIFTQSTAFESGLDFDLLRQHISWTFDVLDWSNNNLKSKLFRTVFGFTQKISLKLLGISKNNLFCSILTNRNFFWQLAKAKAVKADLYIAHNLGALPVAKRAAKKRRVKCGFDAEDFHRYETSDNPLDKNVIIKSIVEEKNLPGVHYFTAASPLIAKAYQKLFPQLQATVILNVFPQAEIKDTGKQQGDKIKFFWFSQTVGENRGIEQMVEAMSQLEPNICELHLLGNTSNEFKNKIEKIGEGLGLQSSIIFHPPCPEKEIFSIASTCDIGLASETGVPYNRDICLTNKIFTYIQSGLAVVASDTTAQHDFIDCYPGVGKVYKRNDINSLADVLSYYHNNREELDACKKSNFQLGQNELNWEREQEKFLTKVAATLIEQE